MGRRRAGERNDPSGGDAQTMDRISAEIAWARDLVKETVELARVLLNSGADADRIHREYVIQGLELLAEIEAQGLLATSEDRGSMAAVEHQIERLSRLRQRAARELDRYSDRD
jgi:hypothetical protein